MRYTEALQYQAAIVTMIPAHVPWCEKLDKDRLAGGLGIVSGTGQFHSIDYVGHKADDCNRREFHFDDIRLVELQQQGKVVVFVAESDKLCEGLRERLETLVRLPLG